MSQKEITILTRALEREKAAREAAESTLQIKTNALNKAKQKLKESFSELELLLNKRDSRLQGVFETIVDGFVVMDMNFNILRMNKSAMEILGFEHQELGYNLKKMVLTHDYKRVTDAFQELITKGNITDFEIKIKTNTNKIIITHINASIIYENDIPVAAQGIIRDITQKKENERAFKITSEITKSILDKDHINDIASQVTQKIANYLKVPYCVIYAVNHSENNVEQITVSRGKINESGKIINKLKFDIGSGIVGAVAKTGESECVHDTFHDTRYLKDINNYHSNLTVPIIIDNQVIAVISSEHPQKHYFNKLQLKTIENIAQIIANKVKNALNSIERQHTQQKLLLSEERLRILISNLQSGLLLEDENRKIVLTNTKFCELFNIPALPEHLVGADCSNAAEQSMHLFENPKAFVEGIQVILENKKTVLSDSLTLVNGNILERDFIPLFNNNIYLGHLWNYRDVTLEKKYANSIELQRQKYRNIITNMNLGLLEVDNDDMIIMCNQSFSNISGYSEAELLGKRAGDLFPDEVSKEKIQIESQKRLQGISTSYEVQVKNKKQENRTWLIGGAPNYNLSGELIGTIGIHLDVTDNKQLQLQKDTLVAILKARNQELSEYAQIVSHDLKSPLRHISALTSWIKEDNLKHFNDVSLEHFIQLNKTLEHMEGLISGVLRYSSINSETSNNERVDLHDIVEKLSNTLHVPSHIDLQIKTKLPIINADKIKMQQLFQNLLQNAISHSDKEKGKIEIGYRYDKQAHTFYVKDNGIGIDKKHHDKIFRIFYYVTKNSNSTGLGLAIVKKIIEIHSGKVWVASEPQKGTTFYFTLKDIKS